MFLAKTLGIPRDDILLEVDNDGSSLLHLAVESGVAKVYLSVTNLVIPSFNTYAMKTSIRYRGTVIWNILTPIIESSGSNNIGMYARGAWK